MIIPHNKIQELYDKYIKINNTEEYKNRYVPLPLEKNNKNWKWEDKDFPRIISLLEFERYIKKYDFQIDKLLTFNAEGPNQPQDPEVEYLWGRHKQRLNVNYEDSPEKYDLHNLCLSHDDFDFVCLSQTLEHVYDPLLCLKNIKKYMSPGGYLWINVPACNLPHSEPYHFYTGFTSMGLAAISYQAGYEIMEIGQWGNTEYLGRLFGITGPEWWADYRMLKNPGLNEIRRPVITWALLKNKQ